MLEVRLSWHKFKLALGQVGMGSSWHKAKLEFGELEVSLSQRTCTVGPSWNMAELVVRLSQHRAKLACIAELAYSRVKSGAKLA